MKKAIVVMATIIIGFYTLYHFTWPMIQHALVQQTCDTYGKDYRATKDYSGGFITWKCVNDYKNNPDGIIME